MQVFDLKKIEPEEKAQVLYKVGEFNARIINLPTNGQIPPCEMDSYVFFYVINGEIEVSVDGETETLDEQKFLITEPATLSMKTDNGAKILGIQIAENNNNK
ncbi:MAG: hypothetical protein KGY45_03235 [Hadesarchaea archaeon]|nr:hypothetical protein [Hadesarchaea archaeon]